MAELLSVSILETKRNEIAAYIATLERQLGQARVDLAHVNATIRLFAVDSTTKPKVYMRLGRLFVMGELLKLTDACLATAAEGVADTRQIAAYAMQAKGWDSADKALLRAVTHLLTHSLAQAAKRGRMGKAGKRNGVNLWRLN